VPPMLLKSTGYDRGFNCHGRGRGFEPRRPRHSFQKSSLEWAETIEGEKKTQICVPFVPLLSRFPPSPLWRTILQREFRLDRRFAQFTSVIRLKIALRVASSLEYSSIVPITLFRYMRFLLAPFSDLRKCQTSGPSRRDLVVRGPCCIGHPPCPLRQSREDILRFEARLDFSGWIEQ
jgi:hypothetical protein